MTYYKYTLFNGYVDFSGINKIINKPITDINYLDVFRDEDEKLKELGYITIQNNINEEEQNINNQIEKDIFDYFNSKDDNILDNNDDNILYNKNYDNIDNFISDYINYHNDI